MGGPVVPVRVEVLGPLRLLVDGTPVEVPGAKRRAVLALLALAEGRVVTAERILDALWPGEVPESGRQALHNHVSRLRGNLGMAADRLQTRDGGYRLDLGPQGLDLAQVRTLLATARSIAQPDPAGAYALLRQAYGLWRGPVLTDLTEMTPIASAVAGLGQLHREVTDTLVDSAVRAGRAEEVVGPATASLAADPLREPAVLLLMRALAATGQAPEALRVGREYRRRLAEETGLDPSPAYRDLEREILGGAAAAAAPPQVLGPGTRLFGRQEQVARLRRLVASERLVTLVGPGGVGKSRVAQEVARHYEAATVLSLAPVTDPAGVPHALAAALNLRVVQGDVRAACLAVLSDHAGLLVIDNCEHLIDPVRDLVGAILAAAPKLAVLATSREPLGSAAEYVWRLAPLPLPEGDDQDLRHAPSVALFLDRARRVRPDPVGVADLHTVAEIVRRLDGMPLAIELAAGRLSTFSLRDLRERLHRSLDLLGGGMTSGESRHRTLRATVEWSYQLLTPGEQRLFRLLSVFVDGVDLDTAERLAGELGPGDARGPGDATGPGDPGHPGVRGGDLGGDPGSVLARLVDASMIEASFEGGTRYHMLEMLRAFGLDRLEAEGEYEAAAARLVRWAVELIGWVSEVMNTEREPEADAVLRRELANLRAAWRLARDQRWHDEAAAMIIGLFDAIAYRDVVELRGWAEELAEDPALAGHPRAGPVLAAAGEAAYHRGDYRLAQRRARAGLEQTPAGDGAWHCLMVLSVAALARGDYDETIEHSLAASVFQQLPRENRGIAALAAAYGGDLARARQLNARGAAGARSPSMRSWGSYVAGEIESIAGHSELAEQHYVRAIELARGAGATFLVGVATVGLLSVRARAGRIQQALGGYRDVIGYFARNGNWTHLWVTLRNLADLLRQLGDEEPALLIHAAADQAPDAPAGDRPAGQPTGPVPHRGAILALAREAIARNLSRA